MSRTAAIIGAGQIGYAAAEAFLDGGWDVRILARSEPGWALENAAFERYTAGEDPAPSADVVLDTIAFDEGDVARYDPDKIGRLVTISSASVYVDYDGRSLDEAGENGFPDMNEPMTEEQMTVPPGPQTYSTRKVRMEKRASELFGRRATNLRPCAIYGRHSRHPREWWFVNRIKDRRRVIPLAFDGESRFHTTSARSIGELAVHLCEEDHGGHFNIADDYPPTVREIGLAIADIFGKRIDFRRIEGPPRGSVGRTPWSIPAPFLVDCNKAHQAGFEDFGDYAYDVADAVEWLRGVPSDEWRARFPQLAAYPWDLFDYVAEDRFLALL